MNTSSPTAVRAHRWKRVLAWIGILAATSVAVLASAAIYTFTLDRDARVLRRSITESLGARIESTIEVHAGEALISAARLGTHWCSELPEPARAALAALRSASVGVYHLTRPSATQRASVLTRAQDAMQRNGWTRIVGVNDHDTTVLVYAPTTAGSAGIEHVCVAVIDGNKLVIASAKADMEKLQGLLPIHEALHRL